MQCHITLCTPKKGNYFPFAFLYLSPRQHPPLTNSLNYPHCFGTAYASDVTSQPNSRERGGASDSKNPDPYYFLDGPLRADFSWKFCYKQHISHCVFGVIIYWGDDLALWLDWEPFTILSLNMPFLMLNRSSVHACLCWVAGRLL